MFCTPWEGHVLSLSLILLFSGAQWLFILLKVLPWNWPSHFFISPPHCSNLSKLPRPVLPGCPGTPNSSHFSLSWADKFHSLHLMPSSSPPIPHPSQESCVVFLNKRSHLSVPWMLSLSWKWKSAIIFFWWATFSLYTEKNHSFNINTCPPSVPQHILFPLPATFHTLPTAPLMTLCSTQLQVSLRHHHPQHPVHACWLNKYINYIFSTLQYKQHSFLEKIFREYRAKLTQT